MLYSFYSKKENHTPGIHLEDKSAYNITTKVSFSWC